MRKVQFSVLSLLSPSNLSCGELFKGVYIMGTCTDSRFVLNYLQKPRTIRFTTHVRTGARFLKARLS